MNAYADAYSCVSVCILHIRMYIHTYTCIYIHTYILTEIHVRTYIFIPHTYIRMYVIAYTFIYKCL